MIMRLVKLHKEHDYKSSISFLFDTRPLLVLVLTIGLSLSPCTFSCSFSQSVSLFACTGVGRFCTIEEEGDGTGKGGAFSSHCSRFSGSVAVISKYLSFCTGLEITPLAVFTVAALAIPSLPGCRV